MTDHLSRNGHSAEFGVLRDASGYRTHRQTISSNPESWHVPKYHVPGNEAMTETACGRPAAEFTAEPVERIAVRRRCQRPGCRQRWPKQPVGANDLHEAHVAEARQLSEDVHDARANSRRS